MEQNTPQYPIETHQTFTIYFGMSKVLDALEDRQIQAFDFHSLIGAFDALCRQFLRVDAYDSKGVLVRKYDNI